MCFHKFPQFFCIISFHLQVFRFEKHVPRWHCCMSDNNRSFLSIFLFCFKSYGIFCAQTIYCRFVAVSNAICNQCVVCAVCVLFLFVVFFRVTSRGCCGSFPVPCVAAEARQAKGQRQRWNTCTKSLPPRVHVDGCALCNTTFQCHPNELK